MTTKTDKWGLEQFIIFVVILLVAASASGYLTFKVQFVRGTAPQPAIDKDLSYQTLRVKDQERKQLHEHFHLSAEDINLEAWADKSSCIVCHSPYPHGKSKKARAIMNLHTEFLTCYSCHLKISDGREVKFGWINPTEFKPEGKPYGTSMDASTGLFAETDDHYSKLTPFIKINGVWQPMKAEEVVDIDFKVGIDHEYMQQWHKLHRETELEEFVRCSSCHSSNGIINFKELGFEPARISQLEKMEIGGMLSNYDTFYFPDFFEEKF